MWPHPRTSLHLSRHLLVLALGGCATGRYSGPSTLSPVAHRGVRALIGATVTLGAKEVGVSPSLALGLGTIGQVALSKAVIYAQHPTWIGAWSLGDAACDLIWSSAVVPVMLVKRNGWKAAAIGALVWGGAAWAVQRRCIP